MKQQAVQVFGCKSGTHGRNTSTCAHTHTHTHTHVGACQWHTCQPEHRFSGFLLCVNTHTSQLEEMGTSHFSLTLVSFLVPFFSFPCVSISVLFVVCDVPLQDIARCTDAGIGVRSRLPVNWWSHRTLTAHDTITPQEKPWARTGRKTMENQDTIWHLWSLNDFLLGVGLRPTGKSQKTSRENYIRENVYAAHLAPSLFAPQMSDYSSTLNLWEKKKGGGGLFPSLVFVRGCCWHSLAFSLQCELPIWQSWRYLESTLQKCLAHSGIWH